MAIDKLNNACILIFLENVSQKLKASESSKAFCKRVYPYKGVLITRRVLYYQRFNLSSILNKYFNVNLCSLTFTKGNVFYDFTAYNKSDNRGNKGYTAGGVSRFFFGDHGFYGSFLRINHLEMIDSPFP